jgi:hypothetical protein
MLVPMTLVENCGSQFRNWTGSNLPDCVISISAPRITAIVLQVVRVSRILMAIPFVSGTCLCRFGDGQGQHDVSAQRSVGVSN